MGMSGLSTALELPGRPIRHVWGNGMGLMSFLWTDQVTMNTGVDGMTLVHAAQPIMILLNAVETIRVQRRTSLLVGCLDAAMLGTTHWRGPVEALAIPLNGLSLVPQRYQMLRHSDGSIPHRIMNSWLQIRSGTINSGSVG